MKHFRTLLLACSLYLLFAAGCSHNSDDFVVEELRSRYNTDFTVVNTYNGNYACISRDYPNAVFRATMNGKTVSDNYASKVVLARMAESLKENMNFVDNDYEVEVYSLIDSLDVTNPNTSVDEYITAHPTMTYCVYVYVVPNGSVLDYAPYIQTMFRDYPNIKADIKLYTVADSQMSAVRNYITHFDKHYDDFKEMLSDANVVGISYDNGTFSY